MVSIYSQMYLMMKYWYEYIHIDWETVSDQMRKPAWLFDSRSLIDPKVLDRTSLNFWRIGDGLS